MTLPTDSTWNEQVYVKAMQSLKKGSLTFYFASFLMPKSSLKKVSAFYFWCREVDNHIDDQPLPEAQKYLESSEAWLRSPTETNFPSASWQGLFYLLQEHPDLKKYVQDLLRGMRHDVEKSLISNMEELMDYCYCVAGTVGASLCIMNNIHHPHLIQKAIQFGQALQLVNICRDVKEDWQRGRVYIPNLSFDFMQKKDFTLQMIQGLWQKAQKLYLQSVDGLDELPLSLAAPFRVAGDIYMAIGFKIEKNPEWSLENRTFVTFSEKIKIALFSVFMVLKRDLGGLFFSTLILTAWMLCLPLSIFLNWPWTLNLQNESFLKWTPLIMALHTFLFTGLFIVAHDALHFNLSKRWLWMNSFLGRLSLLAYGGFSFTKMQPKHHAHHAYTATDKDPDYHSHKSGFWSWYFKFMKEYVDIRLLLFYQTLTLLAYFASSSLSVFLLFWALPAILSSLQLFYFGTYLTHRRPPEGYNHLKSKSNHYPLWLSILTCYNFGYHYEHHLKPSTPWWALRDNESSKNTPSPSLESL